jgi:hypothetical protein
MDEINLEQEFQILMRTVIKQINDKMSRGELTNDEGELLVGMVEDRMQPPARAWNSSNCFIGEDDPDYSYDQGWSPSTC